MTAPIAALLLAAVSTEVTEHRNLEYGDHVRQRLDLSVPAGEGPFPCVVFFHGGGFFMGDKSMHEKKRKAALLEAGVAFATANYRLTDSGPYPQPFEDAARAVQFLRASAAEYGLDPARFAADGHSAGGAMALWLALHEDLADPAAVDPVLRQSTRLTCVAAGHCLPTLDYGQLCDAFGCRSLVEHPAAYTLFAVGSGESRQTPRVARLIQDASPLSHLSAGDPPVYLYYGVRPVRVTPQSNPNLWVHHPAAGRPLVDAAKRVKVSVQHEYPGGRTRDGSAARFLIRRLTGD